MSDQPAALADLPLDFLAFYDEALSQVYGYLLARCNLKAVAEDLTAETFLAAVDAVRRDTTATVSVPWIIGVARHKLVDHWRRLTRETSGLHALADAQTNETSEDPADARLDVLQARQILAGLAPHHQAVLTLRYLDDLPVAEVAVLLGRTVQATEALLTRARRAFKRAYSGSGSGSESGSGSSAGDEETSDD